MVAMVVTFSFLSLRAQQSGRFVVDSIQSEALDHVRKVSIYLPPFFDPNREYPVILATDGQIIEENNYARTLDSLIAGKWIEPCILIAPFSDETPVNGVTVRNLEYSVPGEGNEIAESYFTNHLRFFTQELKDTILKKYAVKVRMPFLFYGCSNGGDYGLFLYGRKEPLFDTYICLSPVNTPDESFKYNANARLYVAYGDKELEFPFGINLVGLQEEMQKYTAKNVTIKSYKGGHERGKWMDSFCTFIKEALH